MAIKFAVATGLWSATATWNGGTLPTAADDVYSNAFTVTIDQNVTVLSLQNGATTGVVAGGGFACSSARTINCSAGAGFVGGATILLTTTGAVTITTLGAITTSAAITTISNTTATLNHTGNITTTFANSNGILVTSSTVNVIGNLTATAGTCLNHSTGNSVNTVIGNLVSNGGSCISMTTNNAYNSTVTGNVTATSSAAMSFAGVGGGPVNVYGTITAGTTPALTCSVLVFTIKLTGPFISGPSGILPIYSLSPIRLIPTVNNEFRFLSSISGTTSLYSSDMTSGPAVTDVRDGITYSYNSTPRIGTLKVPATQYVAAGVLTDNTIGTYDPATDFWNKQTTALTASGSIGERLKNAATVDSTGAQIAAYAV